MDKDTIGDRRRVVEEFRATCCGCTFKVGVTLTVNRLTSPNRVLVTIEDTQRSMHKAKRSTVRRCTEAVIQRGPSCGGR